MGSASSSVKVNVRYFALLREESGLSSETIDTQAKDTGSLYLELKERFQFSLGKNQLKVAINDSFVDWQTNLKDGNEIIFVPPVAGG